jgi:hypothetical protein
MQIKDAEEDAEELPATKNIVAIISRSRSEARADSKKDIDSLRDSA